MRTRNKIPKATGSRHLVPRWPPTSCSITPTISPPMIDPPTDVNPPIAAAGKARRPIAASAGLTDGVKCPSMTPPSPAMPIAIAQVRAYARSGSIPTPAAASMSLATARMCSPVLVSE